MEGPFDTPIDTWRLVLRRLRNDWQLILSIFLGILVATTLISGAPIYLDSLARQSIATTIDSTVARRTVGFLTMVTALRSVPVEDQNIQSSQAAYLSAIERNVSEIHDGTQRHLITPNSVVALPGQAAGGVRSRGRLVEGFFQYYSSIEQRVSFLEGRMAGSAVGRGTQGPMLEAVVSETLAAAFDELRQMLAAGEPVGDVRVLFTRAEEIGVPITCPGSRMLSRTERCSREGSCVTTPILARRLSCLTPPMSSPSMRIWPSARS